MTQETNNALNNEQLKERLNFSKMFDRQKGQIKQTAHIKNLLSSSEPEEKEEKVSTGINQLEYNYKLDQLEYKLADRMSIVENNLNGKLELLAQKPKASIFIDLSNKNLIHKIAGAMILSSLLLSIGISASKKTVTKEKIVYKEIPAKPAPAEKRFVLTKFVNIRTSASSKGKKLTTLSPNSIVKHLETKNGWNKIEYKDHILNKTIIGWAYGENLKEI